MRETMTMKMKQAISNVLETMFFLPVQFIEDACPLKEWFPGDQVLIGATIRFTGPVSGSYFLLIPDDMAKEITINFLGFSKEEISDPQEKDTIKEALNMIGGYILSQIDKADEFQLGIPEIVPQNELNTAAYENLLENMVFIQTEDNHLAAGIRLD
jgi:CheY-specific phosphatase CheX